MLTQLTGAHMKMRTRYIIFFTGLLYALTGLLLAMTLEYVGEPVAVYACLAVAVGGAILLALAVLA